MTQPTIVLNDGHSIPQVGFGAWQVEDATAPAVVAEAIQAGYRLIDTAAQYGNEAGVGRAIRAARENNHDVLITTKLWISDLGYDNALRSFDKSIARLGLGAVDLYLIHWPAPARNLYVDTWRAIIRLRDEGRIRSIGVSNFTIAHLQRLYAETGVMPALNQVELHPFFQQKDLREFHRRAGIATEAWSPLGQGSVLGHRTIQRIAKKHGRTPAQIVLGWHIELGNVVIPKSATPARIRENINVFDYKLDDEDLRSMTLLDEKGGRIGQDPERFTGGNPTFLSSVSAAFRNPWKIRRRVQRLLTLR